VKTTSLAIIVNTPPVAADLTPSTNEDTSVVVTLRGADADDDTPPGHRTAAVTGERASVPASTGSKPIWSISAATVRFASSSSPEIGIPTTIVASAPRPCDVTLPEGPYRICAIAES
jgi:hypothetical protein